MKTIIYSNDSQSRRLLRLITAILVLLFWANFLTAQTATENFYFTGYVQPWIVPDDVNSIEIKAWGAQGGYGEDENIPGGKGGYSEGTLDVTPGEILYIYVGGKGGTIYNEILGGGGFNGGGDTRSEDGSGRGAGGGASDVRKGGYSLYDRVIVAGGGGGNCEWVGGAGGGLVGENGQNDHGGGGTQTSGGDAVNYPWCENGGFGFGGSSGPSYQCAGGGGGWFGGGSACGGGGGSGFISGLTNASMQTGVRNGNGLVSITYYLPNTCFTAQELVCGDIVSGSTVSLDPQNVPFCETPHNGVVGKWFTFTTIESSVSLSTCNPGTDFETELYVYRGDCNDLECVFISDHDIECDVSGRSTFSISTFPGVVYHVFLTGTQNTTGNYELFYNCAPYDEIEDAREIGCGTSIKSSNIAANTDIVPYCELPGSHNGVWFRYHSNFSKCLELSTCDSQTGFDTQLTVFSGEPGNLTCVTSNDDDPTCSSSTASKVYFTALEYTTYYIMVSGKNSEEGIFRLHYDCSDIPELIISCLPDIDLPCDAELPEAVGSAEQFQINGGTITGGSCESGNYSIQSEDQISGNECEGLLILRTYTIINNFSGNTATCTQQITIAPIPAPHLECADSGFVNCLSEIPLDPNGATVTSDCAANNPLIMEGPILVSGNGNCPGSVYEVRYVYFDNCNRKAQCVRTFIIEDNPGPSISCPADLTVSCEDEIDLNPNDAVVDVYCNDSYNVYIRNPIVTGIPGCNGTTYKYEYVVRDDCERQASCFQTITISNPLPVIQAPADQLIACEDDIQIDLNDATVSSTCADYNLYLTAPVISGIPGCPGTSYTYTFRLIDVCGNTIEEPVVFTIEDAAPPVIIAPEDLTFECASGYSPNPNHATVIANCPSGYSIEVSTPDISGEMDCPGTTYTYVYTLTNDCGQTATDIQVITIQNTAPTFNNCPDDNWLQLNCEDYGSEGGTIEVIQAWIYSVTASSSCGLPLEVFNDFNNYDIGTCLNDGITVVNFWATDNCGRSISCQGTVIVTDTEGPTIYEEAEDVWEVCSSDTRWNFQDWIDDQGGAFAEDGCAYQNFTWSTIPANPSIECLGQNGITTVEVTFVATDNCGNSSSTTASFNAFSQGGGSMFENENDQLKETKDKDTELFQNQPNPFIDETSIRFNLPQTSAGTLTIFDSNGRIIKTFEGPFNKDSNEVIIRKNELGASGIYYYQLATETVSFTRSMILIE